MFANVISVPQKADVIKAIEEFVFWTAHDPELYFAKQRLLTQITGLDILISGVGFFTLDRNFLAGVRSDFSFGLSV